MTVSEIIRWILLGSAFVTAASGLIKFPVYQEWTYLISIAIGLAPLPFLTKRVLLVYFGLLFFLSGLGAFSSYLLVLNRCKLQSIDCFSLEKASQAGLLAVYGGYFLIAGILYFVAKRAAKQNESER